MNSGFLRCRCAQKSCHCGQNAFLPTNRDSFRCGTKKPNGCFFAERPADAYCRRKHIRKKQQHSTGLSASSPLNFCYCAVSVRYCARKKNYGTESVLCCRFPYAAALNGWCRHADCCDRHCYSCCGRCRDKEQRDDKPDEADGHGSDDYHTNHNDDVHGGDNNHKSDGAARCCQKHAPESADMTNPHRFDTTSAKAFRPSRPEWLTPEISDHRAGLKNNSRHRSKPDIRSCRDIPNEHGNDRHAARGDEVR